MRPIDGGRPLVEDLRAGWRSFVAFDLLCKVISFALFAPLSAWLLRAILHGGGKMVVSNLELVSFFASWRGLLFIAVWATGGIAAWCFELGGLVLISLGVRQGETVSTSAALRFLFGHFARLLELGFRQFLVLGAAGACFLATVAATKATLLRGGDIYYYLTVRPAEYWWAAIIVAAAAIAAGAAIVLLLVRWLFAVPVLLLEGTGAQTAMAESRRLTREIGLRRIAMPLAGWALLIVLLLVLAASVHGVSRRALMAVAGGRVSLVIAMAGALLALDLLLTVAVGLIAAVSFACVVARLYAAARPAQRLPEALSVAADGRKRSVPVGLAVFGAAAAMAGLAVVFSHSLINQISFDREVQVTAHRGSALVAPENTMAALEQAIQDGADYAEIDVQQTSDGIVVLFHDTDLRRVAGVDKRTWEISYDEMKRLDIGSWFSDEFSDQRVVTLAEAMDAVRGRLKLNIELKINGHGRNLESEVVRLIRQADFESECIVTSLD
ncbi:MAG: hypothetical protein GX621_11820, partial [Pirellulaceae bacterium]|nr:hypothetical protein [Pirellulaceae bacterium]